MILLAGEGKYLEGFGCILTGLSTEKAWAQKLVIPG